MKILIGCPTHERYEYCLDIWLKSVQSMIDFSKDIEIDYLLVDNSESEDFFNKLKSRGINIERINYSENVRERIINSRNVLREKTLNEGYDYFFSLEQDIVPDKDVIKKLLGNNKNIISAYYGKVVEVVARDDKTGEIKNFTIELPVVWFQENNEVRRAVPREALGKGLVKVAAFGLGCVLIHRDILETIKFRYEKEKKAFDDMFFCSDAAIKGYELFLDSGIRAEHFEKAWDKDLKQQ